MEASYNCIVRTNHYVINVYSQTERGGPPEFRWSSISYGNVSFEPGEGERHLVAPKRPDIESAVNDALSYAIEVFEVWIGAAEAAKLPTTAAQSAQQDESGDE